MRAHNRDQRHARARAPGLTPTNRLNTRDRCGWSANPHVAATAAGGTPPPSRPRALLATGTIS
jgi:hypothetical protein